MKTPKVQVPPSGVRLEPSLKTYLKHQAVDNHRTFSAEINYRLEQSRLLDQQKETSK